MLKLIKIPFSLSLVHYPVRQWSVQWPTIIHKRFTLHHLRIRTPRLRTPHIHHLFCFMTNSHTVYQALLTLPLHTTSLWNTTVLIYLLISVESSSKELLTKYLAYKQSNEYPNEEQCLTEEDLVSPNWAFTDFRKHFSFISIQVFFFY